MFIFLIIAHEHKIIKIQNFNQILHINYSEYYNKIYVATFNKLFK